MLGLVKSAILTTSFVPEPIQHFTSAKIVCSRTTTIRNQEALATLGAIFHLAHHIQKVVGAKVVVVEKEVVDAKVVAGELDEEGIWAEAPKL